MVSSEGDGPRHLPAPAVAPIPAVPEPNAAPASPVSPPSTTGDAAVVGPAVPPAASAPRPLAVAMPTQDGEGGEGGGGIHVSNATFVAAVFANVPDGASAVVCSIDGDPSDSRWLAKRVADVDAQCPSENNNYVNCSSFVPEEGGGFRARKANFAACHFFLLDDLGTKVPLERLNDLELSWLIETSPGNFQGGIVLADPITDATVATRLLDAIIAADLCDAGARGPLTRWARVPVAINGKAKHVGADGAPFSCRLVQWRPKNRYSQQQIIDRLQLQLVPVPAGRPQSLQAAAMLDVDHVADDVFTPKATENPVVAALKARGLYKTPLGSGKHDITCPWAGEHTDGLDTGAAYFEPDERFPVGGFRCQHSHGDRYRLRNLLEYLGVRNAEARHQPTIKVTAGELHRVVSAAERVLATCDRYYQCGGLIVSVATDPNTGDPSVVPTSQSALTRELSAIACWEKFDGRSGSWVRADPPLRHIGILFQSQTFQHLPPLVGVARQPYFRETDGELVMVPGYDAGSLRFGVFDPREFSVPVPTIEAAREALALLLDLLSEFRYAEDTDRAAALAAILTAVARPTLPHAPAFHLTAPRSGSGKSYNCDVIAGFAGPAGSMKVSYPVTAEEATKAILALLLTGPAAIEFDDMVTDWIPHGTINRMLTAERITDRVLGASKVATVSTRTLVLASGNNVGPTNDLLRRVVTVRLDPRCSAPATIHYSGSPVDEVRRNRGRYVSAALTIMQAWRRAGSPRANVSPIATYGGAWADYCRHPLIWLGLPDPASSLLEQVRHDPDADALGALIAAWYAAFGSTPTTVRKAIAQATSGFQPELRDAMYDMGVDERGIINHSKLGWVLKKNADRIVNGKVFQRAEADGRRAWRVVEVSPGPPSPPSPPSPVGPTEIVPESPAPGDWDL